MRFTLSSSLVLVSLSFNALTSAHVVPRNTRLPNEVVYELMKGALPAQLQDVPISFLKSLLPESDGETIAVPADVYDAIVPKTNQLRTRGGTPKNKNAAQDPGFGSALLEVFSNVWSGSYDSAPIGKWFAGLLPVQRFARKIRMEPQFRKDARRYLALYGPIELVAKDAKKPSTNNMFSLDPNGQAFIKAMTEGICKNCTIIAGRPGLLDVDTLSPVGPTEGVYIHHVITQDLTKPQVQPVTVCETDSREEDMTNKLVNRFRTMAGSGFIGQGDDNGGSPIMFTAKNKDSPSGYYESGFLTGMNDKYVLYADLVNYSNVTKNVYMMFDIEYLDGHQGSEAISTLISVSGCDLLREPNISKDGPASTMSRNFPILEDSAIISAKGHMHDGGEAMVLYINDEKVCSSDAKYSDGGSANDETITEMTYCPEVINVKKGDVMKMESIYDMKKHPLRTSTSGSGEEGGHSGMQMGTMGGNDLMGMFAIVWAIDPKLTAKRVW